jgi:hypothetical protein
LELNPELVELQKNVHTLQNNPLATVGLEPSGQ